MSGEITKVNGEYSWMSGEITKVNGEITKE